MTAYFCKENPHVFDLSVVDYCICFIHQGDSSSLSTSVHYVKWNDKKQNGNRKNENNIQLF